MTAEDKAEAFIEGRYAKGSDSSENGMNGGPGMMGGQAPDGQSGPPSGEMPDGGTPPDMQDQDSSQSNAQNGQGSGEVGTPDAGTTQSAGSSTDSANYDSFEDMLKAYQEDIESIQSGDEYGNNIVDLYDPICYIGDGDISFSLADAASYRTAGAAKSIPGFDVMDYGQEDYVFGSSAQDARHWDKYVLKVMEENADTLKKLFNN